MSERTAEIGGLPVSYLDHRGTGRPVLLVHGLGGGALNWMDCAPLLARHARVWAIDLFGHGHTASAGRSASISDNAELIADFVREVADDRVTLAGNSMGGFLSMRVAADHPELVEALVLVDPALPQWPDVIDPVVMQLFAIYATPGVGEQFLEQWAETIGPEGVVDQMLALCTRDPSRISREFRDAHVAALKEREGTPRAMDDFLVAARSLIQGLWETDPWREMVRRIEAPTLLVHGEHDRLVSVVAAREVAKIRPDWTLRVMEDCGHIPMAEDPEEFTRIVAEWLGALPRAGTRAARAPAP